MCRELIKITDRLYLVPLTRGRYSLVDENGANKVSGYNWFYDNGYAMRISYKNKERKKVYMHRFLLGVSSGMTTDHINLNGLDNRYSNIRECTQGENSRNKRSTLGSSKYKGVCWCKDARKWHARIKVNRVTRNLCFFDDEEYAAIVYNKAAIKYHGEFARLNKIES